MRSRSRVMVQTANSRYSIDNAMLMTPPSGLEGATVVGIAPQIMRNNESVMVEHPSVFAIKDGYLYAYESYGTATSDHSPSSLATSALTFATVIRDDGSPMHVNYSNPGEHPRDKSVLDTLESIANQIKFIDIEHNNDYDNILEQMNEQYGKFMQRYDAGMKLTPAEYAFCDALNALDNALNPTADITRSTYSEKVADCLIDAVNKYNDVQLDNFERKYEQALTREEQHYRNGLELDANDQILDEPDDYDIDYEDEHDPLDDLDTIEDEEFEN